MQSVTRSVSLTFAAANQKRHQHDQIEAFEGETAALKHFCFPVRSYGTCGDFTPYVPSPSRKCITHIVAEHETLAGIAMKYDITVEDIRRPNSFLWTSNSVWVGQTIKVPVIKGQIDSKTENFLKPTKKKSLAANSSTQIGPSPTEFWTKVDHSIEESKKVTNAYKKHQAAKEPSGTDELKC